MKKKKSQRVEDNHLDGFYCCARPALVERWSLSF